MSSTTPSFSPAMETADAYNRWIVESFAPFFRGTILEVGFGHQGFRRLFPPGCERIAVDVDPETVRRTREADPDAVVLQADVADGSLRQALAGRRVDVVLCVNVLEHVRDDRAAVSNLLACLVPGGHLCLFVPALPALFNNLDRLAGHHRRYRMRDLRALVPPERGRLLRLEYFNPVGAVGWWVNGLLPHRDLASPAVAVQVKLFDRVICPLSRALNRVTRRTFGQSLLMVVEGLPSA